MATYFDSIRIPKRNEKNHQDKKDNTKRARPRWGGGRSLALVKPVLSFLPPVVSPAFFLALDSTTITSRYTLVGS